jgi:hypothetical protein
MPTTIGLLGVCDGNHRLRLEKGRVLPMGAINRWLHLVRRSRHGSVISRSRFKGAAMSAGIIAGVVVTVALFAFQTAQVWSDDQHNMRAVRWVLPSTVGIAVICLLAMLYLIYWLLRSPVQTGDPYRMFAAGILAYGRVLHDQRRDTALLRLRHDVGLTLHVLGFHSERAVLGEWALESAQFTDDKLEIVSILIDELGWNNYLLGKAEAALNIEKAIRLADRLPAGVGEPRRSLLVAKAYRHLGVITTQRWGSFQSDKFETSEKILLNVQHQAPHEVSVELAHLSHAEAIAIATMLEVNVVGKIRKSDAVANDLLRKALRLTRDGRRGFQDAGDQGRFAKSLVLEVRILEAIHEEREAAQLIPLRDRAIAASEWVRPAGAAFITGKLVS